MQTKNKDGLCHVLATITIFLWSSSYTFTPYALKAFTPTALATVRYFFASIFLIIFGCIKKIGLPHLRDLPRFFLAGALGIAIYMVAYNWGAQHVSSSTCSLVLATMPIFTAILASFIFKEKIRLTGWIAIAISFGGILIMTLWNSTQSGTSSLMGILSVLASAILFSGYNMCQRTNGKKYTPLSAAIYSIICGEILLLVFLPEAIPQVAAASASEILLAAYLGLSPAAIGFVLWTYAITLSSNTAVIANYMFATPFITMLMSLVVFGTMPEVGTLVGGAVIILGLVLFSIFNNRKANTPLKVVDTTK